MVCIRLQKRQWNLHLSMFGSVWKPLWYNFYSQAQLIALIKNLDPTHAMVFCTHHTLDGQNFTLLWTWDIESWTHYSKDRWSGHSKFYPWFCLSIRQTSLREPFSSDQKVSERLSTSMKCKIKRFVIVMVREDGNEWKDWRIVACNSTLHLSFNSSGARIHDIETGIQWVQSLSSSTRLNENMKETWIKEMRIPLPDNKFLIFIVKNGSEFQTPSQKWTSSSQPSFASLSSSSTWMLLRSLKTTQACHLNRRIRFQQPASRHWIKQRTAKNYCLGISIMRTATHAVNSCMEDVEGTATTFPH